LRIPILLASAGALALAACGNNGPASGNSGQPAPGEIAIQVSDKDLERQVMAALEDAPMHGLTKDLFLKGGLPADQAQRRSALLRIASDYASALATGRVDPTKIRDVYTVPRPKVDVSAGLAQALQKKQYRDWVISLAPQSDEYRALSKAFVALVQRSPDLPDGDIPAGKTIKRGASDPRIPAIAANLKQLGYLPAELPSGARYTPAIAQAVARFQSDSGQKADGVLGTATLAALNSSPRDRARTLAVAMERLRWLDRNPPATRIDDNTAATRLDYFRDGRPVTRRKVVVGQPDWQTPQLGAPIFQLVANPSWNVPKSIAEKELSTKPASYFADQNIVQKNGRYVQLPGPKNALGQVKFDMKDDEAIYLHDTPAKAMFGQDQRHESHGCVRVEGALDLAETIAASQGVLDKFESGLASGDETFVALKTPIPVRLMYHTAWLGDDGRVHFAQDVYGWDNDVAAALGYAKTQAPSFRRITGDVGP
jgi:murein L,D-transpeptidase YcbB/YkuD